MPPEQEHLWFERMVRAVEIVRERLRRSTAALDAAAVPYAIAGGSAVAAWVAQADESAVRNTPDVDVVLRREDLPAAQAALRAAGFSHRCEDGQHLFLESPSDAARHAVRVFFSGERYRPRDEGVGPDVTEATRPARFTVLTLEALVRSELIANRTLNRLHVRDLIDVGLVDQTWVGKLRPELAARLQVLLDDPDG